MFANLSGEVVLKRFFAGTKGKDLSNKRLDGLGNGARFKVFTDAIRIDSELILESPSSKLLPLLLLDLTLCDAKSKIRAFALIGNTSPKEVDGPFGIVLRSMLT